MNEERSTSGVDWTTLASEAWSAREHARILGNTRVGAAAICGHGMSFVGCNVEHRFRSHDIHAEVNAIGSMVAAGHDDLIAILIVAVRDRFTPCGACLDWIFEFGGGHCEVGYVSEVGGTPKILLANQLMPFYPE